MKWCCALFESRYKSAGERGSSILVGRDSLGKSEFTIQHRATHVDVTDIPSTDHPIAWVSETRIFFCPWCGRKLEDWYGASVERLSRENLRIERWDV